ncbi:MAG TPA: LacI family DNA-binding transcriptional regulator [Thermoleophilaceae bacterium]|nr:LacI family DNA-binding transcriptional regulator [Thermoleophilaceae bacterium]
MIAEVAASNARASSAVTLRDVARVAGVHPATVSRALNEETRMLVNEETARRVLKAAEELDYRPNPIARGLKTNRSYTIGVLIPDLTNPLFPPILRGIEDGLETASYTPLVANTDNDPERELLDSQTMRARQVDGIVAATARRDHRLHDALLEAGIELVLVNRRQAELPVSSATADDRMGMRLAVEYLISLGHERIAHIAGPLDYSTGLDRHEGFHETMRAAGLEPDPELVCVAEAFTEAEGARLCAQLVDRGREFTAVAAANDLLALGCYDVFADHGLRCPQEISVVGFNDMPFADRFHPPLTTIHIPHYEIGAAAAELMLERLQDPDAEPRDVRLEPSLVVRGSTAPPAR